MDNYLWDTAMSARHDSQKSDGKSPANPANPANDDGNHRNLRSAFGRFATGVTVVCAAEADKLRGFTANSFASVSLQPPIISVCLDVNAQCMDVFAYCQNFAVSVLSMGQEDIAHRFAYLSGDRFADTDWFAAGSGSPVMENSLAWFDCFCERRLSLGDHIMLLGRVRDFALYEGLPLVYFRGDYGYLSGGGE